jgi:protein-S-isoprenylcysteine O-methyltransferase Ste14
VLACSATALRSVSYLGSVAVVFHLRVVCAEEPWLARTFGAQGQSYQRRVPGWLALTNFWPRARDDA